MYVSIIIYIYIHVFMFIYHAQIWVVDGFGNHFCPLAIYPGNGTCPFVIR